MNEVIDTRTQVGGSQFACVHHAVLAVYVVARTYVRMYVRHAIWDTRSAPSSPSNRRSAGEARRDPAHHQNPYISRYLYTLYME